MVDTYGILAIPILWYTYYVILAVYVNMVRLLLAVYVRVVRWNQD